MEVLWVILAFVVTVRSKEDFRVFPVLTNVILSRENVLCRNHSELLRESLRRNELWAFQMWDSSVKDLTGISSGNMYQLGHYDECRSVKSPIKAKYCLINVQIHINYTLSDPYSLHFDPEGPLYERIQHTVDPNKIERNIAHVAICLPDSCKQQDIEEYLQGHLDERFPNRYTVRVNSEDCDNSEDNYAYVFKDVLFCFAVILIIAIVGACTYIDVTNSRKVFNGMGKMRRIVACFSIVDNFNDLNKIESNPALNVMYGVRFMMTVSIIVGHDLIVMLTGAIYDYEMVEKVNRNIQAMFICRGEVMVDVFFCFGGLLVTYCYLSQAERKTVHPLKSIILRYCRSMPNFALLTFFYATIYYKLGSGPLWNDLIGKEAKNCQTNWWTNLLMLNNYVNVDGLCILQSWYIPCDFQLFIMAIPLNYLLVKKERLGLYALSVSLVMALFVPFLILYIGEKGPFYYIFNDFFKTLRTNDFFQTIYVPSHTRAAPYLIGMIFGYFYYKLKSTKFVIPLMKANIISIVVMVIGFGCVLSGVRFFDPYNGYGYFEAAVYGTLHRSFFALSGAAILLVMGYSSFPFPRNFFSWHPFVPLGKLTFGAYMTHMLFQLARTAQSRTPVVIDTYIWMSYSLVDIVFGFAAAFVLFLFVENPTIRLVKELLPQDKQKKRPEERAHSMEDLASAAKF